MEKRVALNRSIIVGVLTTLAAIAVIATSMLAPRETEAASNCTYYSDASHTTVVGRFGKDCCNNNVAWGIKTQFSECGGCFPCTPPPR